jgi:hypothetical protein
MDPEIALTVTCVAVREGGFLHTAVSEAAHSYARDHLAPSELQIQQ